MSIRMPTLRRPMIGISLAALALGACSSMSKKECAALDWKTVGYEDGTAGYSAGQIAEHREACGKYGVTPDLEQYRTGREQGLREYCRPPNGYRLGADGYRYEGVCPADLEAPFVAAYDDGHSLHTLEQRVNDASHRLNEARAELDRTEHGMVDTAVAAVARDTAPQDRVHEILDASHQAEHAGQLRAEIADLEMRTARSIQELENFRGSHSASKIATSYNR